MEIRDSALSQEGYVVDQRRTDNISFGHYPSSRNGCGWIAAYNFLKAMDQNPDPGETLRSLEKTLLLGGRLGLNFFALAAYLRRQGIPLACAVRPMHEQTLSERCHAGIMLYRAGRTNHFAAFRRKPDGRLQFFGAEPGNAEVCISLAEFRDRYVKFPLTMMITAE